MKVDQQQAEKEVNAWLDYKRIDEFEREDKEIFTRKLVNAVCDGRITIDENFVLTQILCFPIGGEMPIDKLEYKPRVKTSSIHVRLQNVKPSDADGRMSAIIGAITAKPTAVIKDMDTIDYSLAQAISLFFSV